MGKEQADENKKMFSCVAEIQDKKINGERVIFFKSMCYVPIKNEKIARDGRTSKCVAV